jgi:hypothetical protein
MLTTVGRQPQRIAVLLERLPEPGDIAVPKNGSNSGDQALAHPVSFAVLHRQRVHQSLRDGATNALHGTPLKP